MTGAIIGSIAGLGLCVTVYWLWMRHRNHPNRHLGTRGEAQWHGQAPDMQEVEPQLEVSVKPLSSPVMLHADTTRRTPELPG